MSACRAERRRQARSAAKAPRFVPDADYGVTPGWCLTEADLPLARQSTHDTLIALMGDRRTGPVRWMWWTGVAAVEVLRDLRTGATGAEADHFRRLGAHLREYGGYLVIATARGVPE